MSMQMGGPDMGGAGRPMDTRFGGAKPGAGGGFPGGPMKGPSSWQVYYTPEGHPYYYNTMTGHTQWERPADMDQAPAMPRPGGGAPDANGTASFGPPGSNLFVFHLPSDWSDMDLIQHFQHYGQVLSARIQRDANGRNRGFGFVSFDTPLAASNAIRGMNGFHAGGKWLKVQLKKGEEHFGVNLPPTQPMPSGPRGAGGAGNFGMGGVGGMGQGGQPAWAQPGQGAPRQYNQF